MTEITFLNKTINTVGSLPSIGSQAPDFFLITNDLTETTIENYPSKFKVLNVFPSLDTGVCATSVKKFYQALHEDLDVVVLNISKDLPFAQGRFCDAEGLSKAVTLSGFRSTFGGDYGVEMIDGPLMGLYSRAVIILNKLNQIIYNEQVREITQEPDYGKALKCIKQYQNA